MPASSHLDSTLRSGGPKVRRTREELQELILEAGRELLLSEGLGTGAEHLTFKRVLALVEATTGIRVTNASVIRRIWDNQEEFQLEVIQSIVNDRTGLGSPETPYLGSEDGVMEEKHRTSKRYPSELKERAVKMVQELRAQDPHDKTVISRVARQLGVGDESLRSWVKQAEVEAGKRPGLTTDEQAELKRLRKENFELRRSNDILQSAATFFGAELDRRGKR